MLKLRSLSPLGAVLAAATLFAQQDVPPPPPTPRTPPADPATEPKVNIPGARKETTVAAAQPTTPAEDAPATSRVRLKPVAATPAPAPVSAEAATPAPKKGFWGKFFGRREKKPGQPTPPRATPAPKPAPVPRATPAPKATPVPKPAPAPRATPVPKATPAPKPTPFPRQPKVKPTPVPKEDRVGPPVPKATPAPKAAPAPKPERAVVNETPEIKPAPVPKATPVPRATPEPKVSKKGVKPSPTVDEGADPETVERAKFTQAKATALEDSEVQDLKLKADTAPTEEEARKAMRAYNKALFRKMRSIDPSIKERIDATEGAILRRLGE